ncbi:hypothetical protein CPB84DRAFT_1929508 [Gymnopilus junonius]|uniref:Uncharacterized protein n=1 Tax=Gymnopilus junonius TaxID=109634 RepID=A0A9P5TS11_GYMJU|nr:hypothetical protein CPB84DRAFT_1929508 [Gymnopilus junonius]
MSNTVQRVIQQSTLPSEITDTIIDHLHDDIQALGTCSLVYSEWLVRSRYHIFSTVQLSPCRARRFFDLAASRMCTFVNQISRVEMNGLKRTARREGRQESRRGEDGNEIMLFSEAMSQSHIPSFAGVRSMEIRNVDWTTLTSSQQATLRSCLTNFPLLDRLELHDAVFHDLREVARIIKAFPTLLHLTANITFMKYLEHTLASAETTPLTNTLVSLELGTNEAIPVVLNGLTTWDGPQSIKQLKLQNVRLGDVQYISRTLRRLGNNLQKLSLRIQVGEFSTTSKVDLLCALDFSSLSNIQEVRIEGLKFTKSSIEKSLPGLLKSIESSFLESLELRFQLGPEMMECIDLRPMEKALLSLHFFGMKVANMAVEVLPEVSSSEKEMEKWIRRSMNDLDSRGALNVVIMHIGASYDVGRKCDFTNDQVDADPMQATFRRVDR